MTSINFQILAISSGINCQSNPYCVEFGVRLIPRNSMSGHTADTASKPASDFLYYDSISFSKAFIVSFTQFAVSFSAVSFISLLFRVLFCSIRIIHPKKGQECLVSGTPLPLVVYPKRSPLSIQHSNARRFNNNKFSFPISSNLIPSVSDRF